MTLKVSPRGDREIVMTRTFNAPRALVFEAFTTPELLKRWLLGPPGWEMVTCDVDLSVGGRYRWVWRKGDTLMGMRGVYREVVRPERIVATEVFDQAWYPGEALSTIELAEKVGQTTLTNIVAYESTSARDGVLKSGMERGVEHSYDLLEGVLTSMPA